MHCDGQIKAVTEGPATLAQTLFISQAVSSIGLCLCPGCISESFLKVELKLDWTFQACLRSPLSLFNTVQDSDENLDADLFQAVHGSKSIRAAPDAGVGSSTTATCCSQS